VAGGPPTGRHGYDSSPTPTDWTGTAGQSCSPRWTMPSTASKEPSGAASTRVTRIPSRCGTGPVAASATTAGAAGGPTTTTSSPPPSSDEDPLAYTHAAGLHPCGLACRSVQHISQPELFQASVSN